MPKHLPVIGKTLFSFLLFVVVTATSQPTINSFTPSSGPAGTSVTITGTNFNAVPANNTVYFGAVRATVTSGTTTSLIAVAPVGATYQSISTLNNATGLTGYSSKPFIITFTNLYGAGIPANYFKPKVDFATNTNPFSIAIGDLDGDGKPDLVVVNTNSDNISVLRNISTAGTISAASFAPKLNFPTGIFTKYVAIADLDGDAKPDLAIVDYNNISVLRNTSTPSNISFAPIIHFDLVFTGPAAVAIGDVDGDGKPDLVVANASSNNLSVSRNTSTPGAISVAPKVVFITGGTPSSVSVSDLDGDGKPDIVVGNAAASSNSVSVFRNTSVPGIIAAAPKVDFLTGPGPRSVRVGDIDGDGRPDLIVANSVPLSTTLSILRNTSNLGSISASSFAGKVDFTTGTDPYAVAVADVDGDGKPDLAVTNQGSNSISVLRNTSTSGIINLAPKVDFATGMLPRSLAIGDLDGDGVPEIAVANFNSSTVSVLQIDISILPVTITNVKAYQKNAGVQVEWTMQQESKIIRYEVERSPNGQQFTKLGSVPAKGNSGVVNYSLFDPAPFNGSNLYRIKIIESGNATYTRVLKVDMGHSLKNTIAVYPNPVKGNSFALQINLQKGSYAIVLTNKLGQQLMSKVIKHAGGSATEIMESSKVLAAGVYQLRVTGEGVDIIQRIIIN
ncbi:hypothetical protein BH10BAC3_BH10BAC3_17020 [soil metagenome]